MLVPLEAVPFSVISVVASPGGRRWTTVPSYELYRKCIKTGRQHYTFMVSSFRLCSYKQWTVV